VSQALERAGYQASTEIISAASLTPELKAGRYDGSAALWQSQEREQFLLYSNAYLENRLMLVGTKGSDVAAKSISELAGKKLGVVEGYAYGEELEGSAQPGITPGVSTEENLRALLRGELDYVLADALVIHHLLERYPDQTRERLALGTQPLLTRTLHLAIQKSRPDAEQVIARFNQELTKMLHEGHFHDALEVAWIRADVDGDGKLELVAAGDKVGTEPPVGFYDLVTTGQAPGTAQVSDNHTDARFVIKGVAYDSWQAVPAEHKTATDDLGAKPRTMRLQVFEF
jgi:polar amino acid transport system substrate-binding protein